MNFKISLLHQAHKGKRRSYWSLTEGNCLHQVNLPLLQHYRIHFEGPFAMPVAFVVALLHFSVVFPAIQLLCRCL